MNPSAVFRRLLGTVASALLVLLHAAAQAQHPPAREVTAELAGHAALPASTTVAAPAAAGPLFATAGKFTANDRRRVDALGSLPGISFVGDPKYPRGSGGSLPIVGQSVQGFSAIQKVGRDEFLARVLKELRDEVPGA